jgi:VanZ family protein
MKGMTRTALRVLAWLALLAIVVVTLTPIGLRPHVMPAIAERSLAFAVAGFLFALAYPRRIWVTLVAVLGGAVVLEVLQVLTPTRHGQLLDAASKVLGGCIGIAAGLVLLWLWSRIARQRQN